MGTPVNNDVLAEIGRITANFAILEATLSKAIVFLLGLDERKGHIVTAELSFRNKLNLIDSLYRELISDEDLQASLKEALKIVGQVGEKRNQITHSIWSTTENPQEVTRIKRTAKQGGLKEHDERMTLSDLHDLADEIDLAERHFTGFMRDSFPAQA